MSDKATDLPDSTVIDSGLAEADASASTTNANPSGPANQESGSASFSEISKGVLYLSDSSSQTEKASIEVEDSRWPSSVSSSSTQQHKDDNSTAHSDSTPDSSTNNLRLLESNANQTAWKDGVPTLDAFESVRASPNPSATVSTERDNDGVAFAVGPPDTVPHEEENVESSSAMIVQKPELPITGDQKEDKTKIIRLEAKLRDTQAKVEQLKKELDTAIEKKKQCERQLEKANEKIRWLEDEGARASSAMQEKYERQIADLKRQLADKEKENCDERAKLCKKIEDLQDLLKEVERKRNSEVISLLKEKHQLDLKVKDMETNEERLKRELSEANLEATKLQSKLDKQESQKEIALLRSESESALQKKEEEIRALRQQLSLSSQNSDPLLENSEPPLRHSTT